MPLQGLGFPDDKARTSLPRNLPAHIFPETTSAKYFCPLGQASEDQAPVYQPRIAVFFYFPVQQPVFYNSYKSAAGSADFHLPEIFPQLCSTHLRNLSVQMF